MPMILAGILGYITYGLLEDDGHLTTQSNELALGITLLVISAAWIIAAYIKEKD